MIFAETAEVDRQLPPLGSLLLLRLYASQRSYPTFQRPQHAQDIVLAPAYTQYADILPSHPPSPITHAMERKLCVIL
jgi:hypothetical protein